MTFFIKIGITQPKKVVGGRTKDEIEAHTISYRAKLAESEKTIFRTKAKKCRIFRRNESRYLNLETISFHFCASVPRIASSYRLVSEPAVPVKIQVGFPSTCSPASKVKYTNDMARLAGIEPEQKNTRGQCIFGRRDGALKLVDDLPRDSSKDSKD